MVDETAQHKQYRFEILETALSNSYAPKLTSVEDVCSVLQIASDIASSELSYLTEMEYLKHSIRGSFPRWQISGKAKTAMERKPKDFDEFIKYVQNPPKDNGTPIRISGPDSISFGLHIIKKVKDILATIGVVGIIATILFIASMPNMEVSMYIPDNTIAQYDNAWNTIDVKLELEQKDNRFNDWTNTCFRISNTANYIEIVPIGANNLKTEIKTNAICKECNSLLNHDFLRAQEHVDDCESLQIEKDVENFDFFINLEYNTILPFTNEFKYGCQYVGMTEETRFADADYLFNCDLEYKKWKIAFDKLFKI